MCKTLKSLVGKFSQNFFRSIKCGLNIYIVNSVYIVWCRFFYGNSLIICPFLELNIPSNISINCNKIVVFEPLCIQISGTKRCHVDFEGYRHSPMLVCPQNN